MSGLTFTQALERAELLALQALDASLHERLSCAVGLVRNSRVFQDDAGHWTVDSADSLGVRYSVNGTCNCADAHYNKPKDGLCKHRLAVYLCRKVRAMMAVAEDVALPAEELGGVVPQSPPNSDTQTAVEPAEELGGDLAQIPGNSAAPTTGSHGLDPRHIVVIQGKPFVKFAGLLDLAHRRGLVSLKVGWTYNDAELSLAHAVAVFPFGTFEESGDATPANVNKKVAPHFRRCALTRASARALRLALGLDMVAVEELMEGEA